MSDGCRCEYLSEECNGANVVCQHCYDSLKRELNAARDALREAIEAEPFKAVFYDRLTKWRKAAGLEES